MKVMHTFSQTGQTVTLLEDTRFPNGPLSRNDEDVVEFLDHNIKEMKLASDTMGATQDRQNLLLEIEKQKAILNRLKGRINDKILAAKNRITLTK